MKKGTEQKRMIKTVIAGITAVHLDFVFCSLFFSSFYQGRGLFQALQSFEVLKYFHGISRGGFFSLQEARRGTIEEKGTVSRGRERTGRWCRRNMMGRSESWGAGVGWVAKWRNDLRENLRKQGGHSASGRFQFMFPPPGESFFICGDYRVSQIFLLSKHAGQIALGQWEGNIPQVLLFARKCRVREIKDSLDGSCFLSFSAGNSYNSPCIYAVDLK